MILLELGLAMLWKAQLRTELVCPSDLCSKLLLVTSVSHRVKNLHKAMGFSYHGQDGIVDAFRFQQSFGMLRVLNTFPSRVGRASRSRQPLAGQYQQFGKDVEFGTEAMDIQASLRVHRVHQVCSVDFIVAAEFFVGWKSQVALVQLPKHGGTVAVDRVK